MRLAAFFISMAANCPTCPSRNDSPLSIIGNIAGVLTLVYALLVGIFYYINLARNSRKALASLFSSYVSSLAEVLRVRTRINEIKRREKNRVYINALTDNIFEAVGETQDRLNELADVAHIPQIIRDGESSLGWTEYVKWRRTCSRSFVFTREKIETKSAEKDEALERLRYAKRRREQVEASTLPSDQTALLERQQKAMQEQYESLQAILRRLEALEGKSFHMRTPESSENIDRSCYPS